MKSGIMTLAAALVLGWAVPADAAFAAQRSGKRIASASTHRAQPHKKAASKPIRKKAGKKARKSVGAHHSVKRPAARM